MHKVIQHRRQLVTGIFSFPRIRSLPELNTSAIPFMSCIDSGVAAIPGRPETAPWEEAIGKRVFQ